MAYYSKTIVFISIVLCLLFTSNPCLAKTSDQGVKFATVNGTPLFKAELDREMTTLMTRMMRQGMRPDPEGMENLKKEMMENIINREMLAQKAKAAGALVDDGVVAKNIMSFKKRFPDDNGFKAALDQMGLTEAELAEQVKKGLSIKKLIKRDVVNHIKVTDKETRRYYDTSKSSFMEPEMVKASHILVKVDRDADDGAKQKAFEKISALEARLKNDENFAALAIASSEGPSKSKGGDLGFFKREQMVKPFSDAAFALETGEMSGIVETRFGYHLIKVTDRKPARILTYDKVKEDIKKLIKRDKEQKAIEEYIEKLRKSAKIERFPI